MATTTQLLDLDGVAQRQSYFEFDLLDLTTLASMGELVVDRTEPPSVSCDTSRAITRSMDGIRIPVVDFDEIDTAQVAIRVWMRLENGDRGPLGTFVFMDDSRVTLPGRLDLSGQLADRAFLVDVASPVAVSYPGGTSIETIVRDQLEAVGITNGVYSVTGASLGDNGVGWAAGTSRLSIINEAAAIAGATPLFFDEYGLPVVQTPPDFDWVDPSVVYEDGKNILATQYAETSNRLTAPNLFVVYESSPTAGDISGEYELPASFPHSYAQIGRHRPLVRQEQGLANASAAVARAKVLSVTDGAVVEAYAFDGPVDWRHVPYGVVEFRGRRCLDRRWSMSCSETGLMSHYVTGL